MRGSPGGKKSARVFQTFQIPASAPSSASTSGGGRRGASPGRGGDFLGKDRQERIRLGARRGGSERGRMAAKALGSGCEGRLGACPARPPPPPSCPQPGPLGDLQIAQKLLSLGPSEPRSLESLVHRPFPQRAQNRPFPLPCSYNICRSLDFASPCPQ